MKKEKNREAELAGESEPRQEGSDTITEQKESQSRALGREKEERRKGKTGLDT